MEPALTGMVTQATIDSDVRNFAYAADDERISVKRGSSWTWTVRDQSGKVLREFTSLETSNPMANEVNTVLRTLAENASVYTAFGVSK